VAWFERAVKQSCVSRQRDGLRWRGPAPPMLAQFHAVMFMDMPLQQHPPFFPFMAPWFLAMPPLGPAIPHFIVVFDTVVALGAKGVRRRAGVVDRGGHPYPRWPQGGRAKGAWGCHRQPQAPPLPRRWQGAALRDRRDARHQRALDPGFPASLLGLLDLGLTGAQDRARRPGPRHRSERFDLEWVPQCAGSGPYEARRPEARAHAAAPSLMYVSSTPLASARISQR